MKLINFMKSVFIVLNTLIMIFINIINCIINYLDDRSTLITAAATVALVIVTMHYSFLLYSQNILQQDPILKINPGEWIVRGNQPGIINLALYNTGISDVCNIRIFEDYFVPIQDNPLVLYPVGMVTLKEDKYVDILKSGEHISFQIKFDHLLGKMKYLLQDKKGNQYRLVRIQIMFSRKIDKKEFTMSKIYIIGGGENILIKEDERGIIEFYSLPMGKIKRFLGH